MELKITLDDESIRKLKDMIVETIREQAGELLTQTEVPEGKGAVSAHELRSLVRGANEALLARMNSSKARNALLQVLKDSGSESITQLKESEYDLVAEKLQAIINGG